MNILHHDIFLFWLCVFLFTFLFILFMESSGQKRGRISSVVEASSSASATPGDDDPRKKKVGRQDAHGKDEFRSEPSTSHTPPNPEPEAPSISLLRDRIKFVIRSCQRKNPTPETLDEICGALHLNDASAEKRVKINQILDNMAQNSWRYLYPTDPKKKESPRLDFIVKVIDWERDQNSNIFTGVGI
jgi:hypothetical protein